MPSFKVAILVPKFAVCIIPWSLFVLLGIGRGLGKPGDQSPLRFMSLVPTAEAEAQKPVKLDQFTALCEVEDCQNKTSYQPSKPDSSRM